MPGSNISEPVLNVRNLSKHFVLRNSLFSRKKIIHAVRNVSFEIFPGEVLGLVGESGSGKSTVANLILNLLDPSSGSITLYGEKISSLSTGEMRRFRKDLQIVFQSSNSVLDPGMTIGELLKEPLAIHGITPTDEFDEEINRLLTLVGLSPDEKRKYPHQLSGGQIQRVTIARAVAVRPGIIVCDEPVSALDISVQGQILNLLIELKEELNLTYLFISHDLNVIRHICDRIAVMENGNLVEIGTREDIFDRPRHEYTRYLLNSEI